MKVNENLQNLMKFKQKFTVECFDFVQFHSLALSLSVLSKVYRKISALFGLIQNIKILDLPMAKVENVKIRVTPISRKQANFKTGRGP